jgi:hypothetical protein
MDFKKIRFYHLHKQNLIQKAAASDYSKLLIDHIGLHSTDYLTPYLSLWARVKDFEPKFLFDDLNEPCNALRMRAFRGTIFVIHRENLKNILSGSKKFLGSIIKQNEKFLLKAGLDLSSIEQAVVKLLSHKNMLTGNEIKKQLPDHLIGEYFNYALRYLEFSGILMRTSHRHITDKVIRYGLMEQCFPDITTSGINPDEALKALVLKYIKKFGPICLEDLSWWLSITKTAARQVLEALNQNLISFNFNQQDYYMEQDDYKKWEEFSLNRIEVPIVNFLPYEDHFPKAYSTRNWFLSEEVSRLVQKEGTIFLGQIFPSIWLNGEIIGGWEMNWVDKTKSEMNLEVTEVNKKLNLSYQINQLIESQRKELETFVNEKLVPLMNK